MKISEYTKNYTDGRPVTVRNILSEVREFAIEVLRWDKEKMSEEFEDVFHFVQLWMYRKFNLDGEIWKITRHSVKKFIDRKSVWNKIYAHVGLPENISGYVGNYKKVEKVIAHLGRFGISKELAVSVHDKIVLGI